MVADALDVAQRRPESDTGDNLPVVQPPGSPLARSTKAGVRHRRQRRDASGDGIDAARSTKAGVRHRRQQQVVALTQRGSRRSTKAGVRHRRQRLERAADAAHPHRSTKAGVRHRRQHALPDADFSLEDRSTKAGVRHRRQLYTVGALAVEGVVRSTKAGVRHRRQRDHADDVRAPEVRSTKAGVRHRRQLEGGGPTFIEHANRSTKAGVRHRRQPLFCRITIVATICWPALPISAVLKHGGAPICGEKPPPRFVDWLAQGVSGSWTAESPEVRARSQQPRFTEDVCSISPQPHRRLLHPPGKPVDEYRVDVVIHDVVDLGDHPGQPCPRNPALEDRELYSLSVLFADVRNAPQARRSGRLGIRYVVGDKDIHGSGKHERRVGWQVSAQVAGEQRRLHRRQRPATDRMPDDSVRHVRLLVFLPCVDHRLPADFG